MYHCDDCGKEGTPRMLGRVLVCTCGSVELRWLPRVHPVVATLAERLGCSCNNTPGCGNTEQHGPSAGGAERMSAKTCLRCGGLVAVTANAGRHGDTIYTGRCHGRQAEVTIPLRGGASYTDAVAMLRLALKRRAPPFRRRRRFRAMLGSPAWMRRLRR